MLGPEWFIKPHIKAYNTPLNGNFYFQVRQSLSEYLNMITSSPLFWECTHPGVASALCSTLGITPYFSVSLSLLVLRVQVAFHLYLWGQPIKGWSIYVLILWVLQCLHRAHHLDKSQLVPGTCACPLLVPSSRVLMLHKSPTYCPRQMSSSSLIFSMGAIFKKVNPTFVFILIIATSLAIDTPIYLYPAITLALRRSELGSYHGPYTFSKVSSLVVIGRLELGLLSWPSHLLSKVSSLVVIRRSELGLISWPSHLL